MHPRTLILIGLAFVLFACQATKEDTVMKDTLMQFYSEWIAHRNPLRERLFARGDVLTEEFKTALNDYTKDIDNKTFDPILCSDEKPTSVEVEVIPAESEGETGMVAYIHEEFVESEDLDIRAMLTQVDGVWKIDQINCPVHAEVPQEPVNEEGGV